MPESLNLLAFSTGMWGLVTLAACEKVCRWVEIELHRRKQSIGTGEESNPGGLEGSRWTPAADGSASNSAGATILGERGGTTSMKLDGAVSGSMFTGRPGRRSGGYGRIRIVGPSPLLAEVGPGGGWRIVQLGTLHQREAGSRPDTAASGGGTSTRESGVGFMRFTTMGILRVMGVADKTDLADRGCAEEEIGCRRKGYTLATTES